MTEGSGSALGWRKDRGAALRCLGIASLALAMTVERAAPSPSLRGCAADDGIAGREGIGGGCPSVASLLRCARNDAGAGSGRLPLRHLEIAAAATRPRDDREGARGGAVAKADTR